MATDPAIRMSGWVGRGSEEVQERSHLLDGDADSDIEDVKDEEKELESNQRIASAKFADESRSTSSWFRIWIISIFIFLTIGSIISYLLSGKHVSKSSRPASVRPQEDYILDPHWNFSAPPMRREYHWTIQDNELNPDGVYRPMILINNMFPGPLIECNEGDEIWVHVYNRASNATSIHWHGLYQNGSNWMDGTVGVTQCPIAPGADFTYKFRVENQSGTYWYHSHMSVQSSDGLIGPFIIHSRKEKELQKINYTTDRVVMVQDHYYDLSSALLMQYLAPDNENTEPVPSTALINGRNVRNCDTVPNRRCDNSTATQAYFPLEKNQSHRLRIINTGAFAEFQIQFDEHEFAVTEVDGTDVMPAYYHRLNIQPAQRYSVILRTSVEYGDAASPDEHSGLFWLRARMITHCFGAENPELIEEVRSIIQYTISPSPSSSAAKNTSSPVLNPESRDWPEIIEVLCKDMNTSKLSPISAPPVPQTAETKIHLRANFEIGNWALSRGFFNSSSWRTNTTSPTLFRAISALKNGEIQIENNELSQPETLDNIFNPLTEQTYTTHPTHPTTIDILVQNLDDGPHPLHLHGHKFFILSSGHGYPPPNLYSSLNLTNPLYRDTASVEAFGWILIRWTADNPGMWAFHCHLSWHAEAGMMMEFLVRGDVVKEWRVEGEVGGLCKGVGIERGMGWGDEVWVGGGEGGGRVMVV